MVTKIICVVKMVNCNHYDCKHFKAYDDGDFYCKKKKEFFWIIEETPICEDFDIIDNPVYTLEEMGLKK